MKYVLACNCGCTEFVWTENSKAFICEECGDIIYESEAGFELIGEEN